MKQKLRFDFKNKFKFKLIGFLLFINLLFFPLLKKITKKFENIKKSNFEESIEYEQDDLTIVTAYYKIKSKHPFSVYLSRLKNFVKLNHSIVFFASKSFINNIKELRPKNLLNKTKFIEMEIEDFYSYKKFGKEFNESFFIDIEKRRHSVPLYLIWAEKCFFLKKAILNNYFNSKCFFWIDAGFFINSNLMNNYINWPSTKKCYENPKVLINSIRKVPDLEKKNLLDLNFQTYEQFQKKTNVAGNAFGGQPKYLMKFIYYYYKTIKLFIRHKFFIGKDQNLFAFVVFSHPEIVNLVHSGKWYYFIKYLS